MTDATNISAPRPILKLDSGEPRQSKVIDVHGGQEFLAELERLKNTGWRVFAFERKNGTRYKIFAYPEFN